MAAPSLKLRRRPAQRFIFEAVDWNFYETVLKHLNDRHVFATYDRGRLEVMSPSWQHERYAELLAILVRVACEQMDTAFASGGSTTFRKKVLEGGLEPDSCFYIQNVAVIQGKRKINLAVDPPPDLAIEIEVSRRLLDRIGIYQRLKVPEIWRNDGEQTHILLRRPGGKYESGRKSIAFPWLALTEVDRLLKTSWDMNDDLAWTKAVRKLVKRCVGKAAE